MKRFLYDALIIVLLVLVGLSLDDSTTYVDKQTQLDSFQQKIKEGEVVDNKEGTPVVNQIEDNTASSFAKGTSRIIGEVVEGSVRFVSDFFETLVSES